MAKAVEASIVALTKNIDQVITVAVQQMAIAQTKSRKNAVPEIFGPGGEGDPNKNFTEIAGNKLIGRVVTVYTRRYAIEDKEHAFITQVRRAKRTLDHFFPRPIYDKSALHSKPSCFNRSKSSICSFSSRQVTSIRYCSGALWTPRRAVWCGVRRTFTSWMRTRIPP
jgi:hypothetical protein